MSDVTVEVRWISSSMAGAKNSTKAAIAARIKAGTATDKRTVVAQVRLLALSADATTARREPGSLICPV
jgi:hypothetical protein